MDISKKRLGSYRTPKGRLTRVPDELLVDILLAWEQWTGPGTGFYSALGANHRKMAGLIGRAKKIKREGFFVHRRTSRHFLISRLGQDLFQVIG